MEVVSAGLSSKPAGMTDSLGVKDIHMLTPRVGKVGSGQSVSWDSVGDAVAQVLGLEDELMR